MVCTLATAAGGWLFATRDASPAEAPPPAPPRSPDYALTDEEAIAEFERLHELQVQAYEDRDLSLVSKTYTVGSPVRKRVEQEITSLLRRNVMTKTEFATRRVKVVAATTEEVVLNQVAVIDAAFFDSSGAEVSLDAPPELQTIRWTLRRENYEWLIHDAEIMRARRIVRGRS